jgi:hypothetical protein
LCDDDRIGIIPSLYSNQETWQSSFNYLWCLYLYTSSLVYGFFPLMNWDTIPIREYHSYDIISRRPLAFFSSTDCLWRRKFMSIISQGISQLCCHHHIWYNICIYPCCLWSTAPPPYERYFKVGQTTIEWNEASDYRMVL